MKNYTRTEKDTAKARLPQPVLDFIGSKALTAIYDGIEKKLGLTIPQAINMAEIANVTLMKLEDEHAVETNIHQLMPELSNAAAKELAADMQDRIFKEGQRRERENILDPDKWVPAVPELTPEEEKERERLEIIDAMDDDSPELLALEEKERAEKLARDKAEEEELAAALREKGEWEKKQKNMQIAQSERAKTVPAFDVTILPTVNKEEKEWEILQTKDGTFSSSPSLPPLSPVNASPQTIAEQNLAAPATTAPEKLTTKEKGGEIKNETVATRDNNEIKGMPEDVLPGSATSAPRVAPTPIPPAGTRYVGGNDPYREPIE